MLREGLLFLSESPTAKKLLTGTPMTRAMSRRFVPGETIDDLLEAMREAEAEGLTTVANYLGEAEKNRDSARDAARTFIEVFDRVAAEGLDARASVKFTQLGQAISDEFLAETLTPLLERAKQDGLFIRFDMESSDYTQRTLDAFEKYWADGWRNIGIVLQSYLYRTGDDVDRMNELGAEVRLCKGAYKEPPEVAWQERDEIDRNFVEQMKKLLDHGNYPAIATHDKKMIRATIEHARARGFGADRFEFQMLHGVRRDLQEALRDQGWRVRVYIPFGQSWYPYLMRRLAERPANVMFMASSLMKEMFGRGKKGSSLGDDASAPSGGHGGR